MVEGLDRLNDSARLLSSPDQVRSLPEYRDLLDRGAPLVPELVAALSSLDLTTPSMMLLRDLTGEDPVAPDHRGRVSEMVRDWVRWGEDLQKGYDPSEPRDDHGRWTDGGSETGGTPDRSDPKWHATVLETGRAAARDLGFDPDKVKLGTEYAFTLNGKDYKAAGLAHIHGGDIEKGTIKLIPGQLGSEGTVRAVVAHEVMHMKFQNALDRYREESNQVMSDPGPPPDPSSANWWQRSGGGNAIMKADGTLFPPYDAKYPIYQAMQVAYYYPSWEDFAKADGVSDYSFEYWKAQKENKVGFETAVHETLAEMARVKVTQGKFPDHMGGRILSYRGVDQPKPTVTQENQRAKLWRDLYRTVEKLYRSET